MLSVLVNQLSKADFTASYNDNEQVSAKFEVINGEVRVKAEFPMKKKVTVDEVHLYIGGERLKSRKYNAKADQ